MKKILLSIAAVSAVAAAVPAVASAQAYDRRRL
jgi:Ni/Co efflux regulator RcnB